MLFAMHTIMHSLMYAALCTATHTIMNTAMYASNFCAILFPLHVQIVCITVCLSVQAAISTAGFALRYKHAH